MKRLTFLLLLFPLALWGQDFKIGYSEPAADANPEYRNVILEIEGIDNTGNTAVPKGILIPSMTLTQRNQITSAPVGLMVFVTTPGSVGFYYNASNGSILWERIASGPANSVNNIFTVTDAQLQFDNSASKVEINTAQNNTLEIGKNGNTFIQIPQGAGSSNTQSGIGISDNGNFDGVNIGSLVTFTSANKGILLPRLSNLASIPNPPFGLMVIKSGSADNSDGVYIQMGANPTSPAWRRIDTSP